MTQTDYDELAYYWTAWHDAASANVHAANYTTFVKYQNDWAKANGKKYTNLHKH